MRVLRGLLGVALCLCLALRQGLALTTSEGSGGVQIVDGSGNVVQLHGISWYGFNIGYTVSGRLLDTTVATGRDYAHVVYRMKQLGFNAIRLPFAFDAYNGLRQPPFNYTGPCTDPGPAAVKASLVPPVRPQALGSSGLAAPAQDPPRLATPGVCNDYLPNDSTLSRYLWAVRYFAQQGFYVCLDYHSSGVSVVGQAFDDNLFNRRQWQANWVSLLQRVVSEVPETSGKLLVDLINEPDGFNLTWEGTLKWGSTKVDPLTTYYLDALDAMVPVCPTCLFLLEGTGQTAYAGINWGNGFLTDPAILKAHNLSDPNPFFKALVKKPYVKQVALAPHIYCPQVANASSDNIFWYSGPKMFEYLNQSYGYLTTQGYCDGGTCTKFTAVNTEFGSSLNNTEEVTCFKSIIDWMTKSGQAASVDHQAMTSWFYWVWNSESGDTGGLVAKDQVALDWTKLDALTGGTQAWPTGLGLKPWYTQESELGTTPQAGAVLTPWRPAGADPQGDSPQGGVVVSQQPLNPNLQRYARAEAAPAPPAVSGLQLASQDPAQNGGVDEEGQGPPAQGQGQSSQLPSSLRPFSAAVQTEDQAPPLTLSQPSAPRPSPSLSPGVLASGDDAGPDLTAGPPWRPPLGAILGALAGAAALAVAVLLVLTCRRSGRRTPLH